MRVFKPQFRDRATGEMRETELWYVDFCDHKRHRRRIPAPRCRTKKEADRFGENTEQLVIARQYGDKPDRKLSDWLRGLPRSTLDKLAEIDLIDAEYAAASVPLSKHVQEFETWLRSTKARSGFKRNPSYIHNVLTQLECIFKRCKFVYWRDITKGSVESCLGTLDVSSKTYNMYLGSFKLFVQWMIENGRADVSPIAGLRNVRWVKTESRRALSYEEACRLLSATALDGVRDGMTGIDRATLYFTALATGYRSNELRHLTVGCFDFDNATVNLSAEHTKNREDATQYLKLAWAERFRTYLAGRGAEESVFNMPKASNVIAMFRHDLKLAGIEPTDERGCKLVFHSLRHTLATALDRSGASLKERMKIIRHSDKSSLTVGTYTHLEVIDLRSAVERLPDYPWPTDTQEQRAEKVA